MSPTEKIIDFENPPVIEVVCGIQFNRLDKMQVKHIGLLWELFKDHYPGFEQKSPLLATIERWDEKGREINVNLTDVPPLPRIWLLNEDETEIIQIQQDRFIFNWKKNQKEEKYPNYSYVFATFLENLAKFKSFLNSHKLGEINPTQFEITYVNHIPKHEVWKTFENIGKIFPDFSWRSFSERFLPEMESLNWKTSFCLPDQKGRLHVSIKNGYLEESNTEIIRADLTVRGISKERNLETMQEWFDEARRWIVLGFRDLTGTDVQKRVWGLKNE